MGKIKYPNPKKVAVQVLTSISQAFHTNSQAFHTIEICIKMKSSLIFLTTAALVLSVQGGRSRGRFSFKRSVHKVQRDSKPTVRSTKPDQLEPIPNFSQTATTASAASKFKAGITPQKKQDSSVEHGDQGPKWHDGLGALAAQVAVASTIDSVIRTAVTVPMSIWLTKKMTDDTVKHRCHYVQTPAEKDLSSNEILTTYCPDESKKHWSDGSTCQSADIFPTIKYQGESLLICPSNVPGNSSINLCC